MPDKHPNSLAKTIMTTNDINSIIKFSVSGYFLHDIRITNRPTVIINPNIVKKIYPGISKILTFIASNGSK